MAVKRTETGQLVIDGSLTTARTFNSKGGGYLIQIESDDEQAINLVSRARKHASAVIKFEFYEIEELVEEDDPSQQELDGLDDN